MIPYRTAFIVLVVSLSASFPARAAEDKTGEQIREFNRALVYHQRFLDDARSKVTVDPAREKALAAFRISVEPLAKLTGPELTKQLDRCQKDLEAIESFLPVEGDRIARTEAEEEAKTLAALNPGPGWNMGVSVLSFGRFGWNTTDGLLCDTVAFESRKTTKEDEQLGRVPSADLQISDLGCDVTFPETNLRLSLAPAGAKALKARVADISWIGKHFILDADAQKDVGQVYTSLQRPATRFVYRSPEVTCVWQGIDPAQSFVTIPTKSGLRKIELKTETTFALTGSNEMAHPWLLLDLFDKARPQHILVAIQIRNRLRDLRVGPDKFVLRARDGEIGDLWLLRPLGIDRKSADTNPALVAKINRLTRLNLAWPTVCHEIYRIDESNRTVAIRNQAQFEILRDAWNTTPLEHIAVPPLVMFARTFNVPVKINQPVTDWSVPTGVGPFGTVEGRTLDYSLPIPPMDRHGLLAVDANPDFVKLINTYVYQQGNLNRGTCDCVYVGVASGLQAWPYLKKDARDLLEKQKPIVRATIRPERFWKLNKWRMEPFSKRRYCYDYPGSWYAGGYVNDINWGNALVLYGLDQWGAWGGMWKEVDDAWPRLIRLTDFFVKSHDWAWMADSITEHGEGAAIDCLTADYAGLVAFTRMARTLGKTADADRALYLTAKTALPSALRFAFLQYIQRHDMWHTDSPGIGTVNGFHEFNAWIHPKHDEGWWGICSLSGYGVQPEFFDNVLLYLGRKPVLHWLDMFTKIYPDWYDGHKKYTRITVPMYNCNSGYITLPVIYLYFRLGATDAQIRAWLEKGTCNTYGYMQIPNTFGEIASRNCPVQLADWGPAQINEAKFDQTKKEAQITLTNPATKNINLVLTLTAAPKQMTGDGQSQPVKLARDRWAIDRITLSVKPGKTEIKLTF